MSSKQPRPIAKSVFWKKSQSWTKQIPDTRYVKAGTMAWGEFEGMDERVRVFYDPRFLNLPFLKRWSVYVPRTKPVPQAKPQPVKVVAPQDPVPAEAIHLSSADSSPNAPHDYTARGEIPEDDKDYGRSPALRPVRSLFPPHFLGGSPVLA